MKEHTIATAALAGVVGLGGLYIADKATPRQRNFARKERLYKAREDQIKKVNFDLSLAILADPDKSHYLDRWNDVTFANTYATSDNRFRSSTDIVPSVVASIDVASADAKKVGIDFKKALDYSTYTNLFDSTNRGGILQRRINVMDDAQRDEYIQQAMTVVDKKIKVQHDKVRSKHAKGKAWGIIAGFGYSIPIGAGIGFLGVVDTKRVTGQVTAKKPESEQELKNDDGETKSSD